MKYKTSSYHFQHNGSLQINLPMVLQEESIFSEALVTWFFAYFASQQHLYVHLFPVCLDKIAWVIGCTHTRKWTHMINLLYHSQNTLLRCTCICAWDPKSSDLVWNWFLIRVITCCEFSCLMVFGIPRSLTKLLTVLSGYFLGVLLLIIRD